MCIKDLTAVAEQKYLLGQWVLVSDLARFQIRNSALCSWLYCLNVNPFRNIKEVL
jgi:hypothetical protein